MRQIEYKENITKEIKQILLDNSNIFIDIKFSTLIEDTKYATDFTVNILNKNIAVRVREPDCKYRDFTIRAKAEYNGRTEIHKIKEGYGDIYLYCWKDINYKINEYMIIDINKLRDSDLLNIYRKIIMNNDNTGFIYIGINELEKENCLLVKKLLDCCI